MPDYRETIIRLDHDAKIAEIWTESRAIIRRCAKFGYPETQRQLKGVWLRLPIRAIHIKKWPPSRSSRPNRGQFKGAVGSA